MPFTDGTLATFMATELGDTGAGLGLTAGSTPIVSAVAWVTAILRASIASQTDDLKTMTVATWRAWIAAKSASAKDTDLKGGSAALSLSQQFDHIEKMLRDAEAAALQYSEVRAMLGGFVPVPWFGGTSHADKYAARLDPDRVQPFFTRDMHEPPGVGRVSD